jgi:hypothetical protein
MDVEFALQQDGSVRILVICVCLMPTLDAVPEYKVWSADASAGERGMDVALLREAVEALFNLFEDGWLLTTWSGVNSDWRFLAAAVAAFPAAVSKIRLMTMHHVDLAFLRLCSHGHMMGLDAVSQHCLAMAKPASSADVQTLWTSCSDRVLALVRHDAVVTAVLLHVAIQFGELRWATRTGRIVRWHVPQCYRYSLQCGGRGSGCAERSVPAQQPLMVHEAMLLPRPPREWSRPISRASCVDWFLEHCPVPLMMDTSGMHQSCWGCAASFGAFATGLVPLHTSVTGMA